MRPKYPHRKQIKTVFEAQFSINSMLNNEIENKLIKKDIKNNSGQFGLTC
jgi:hypothetical protein